MAEGQLNTVWIRTNSKSLTQFSFMPFPQILVQLIRAGGDLSLKNNRGESVGHLATGYNKAKKVLQEAEVGGVVSLEKYGDLSSIPTPNDEL